MTRSSSIAVLTGTLGMLTASPLSADPLRCTTTGVTRVAGLTAEAVSDVLTLAWDGEAGQQVRLRLAIDRGTPTIWTGASHGRVAIRRRQAALRASRGCPGRPMS